MPLIIFELISLCESTRQMKNDLLMLQTNKKTQRVRERQEQPDARVEHSFFPSIISVIDSQYRQQLGKAFSHFLSSSIILIQSL